MKKYNVKFSEYIASPGKCLKAVVKMDDANGDEIEHTIYAKKRLIHDENRLVSITEVSEEEYAEWLGSTSLGYCGMFA